MDQNTQPPGNPNTYDTAELVVFDCEPIGEPLEDIANGSLPPGIPFETVRLAGRLASRHLPENQKSLIRMMVDGKTKEEIAKELQVSFPQLYYLWRDAYRGTKNALDTLPEIDADLRHWTLVRITHFARGK